MPQLDIQTVELSNSKLIEASAGTGKTYSVAILVLRLITEKGIPIDKILIVTFTKAAVAELELRIRKFVRLAYSYAASGVACDHEIQTVVDGAEDKDAYRTRLKTALQSLDELSVMTIHGFCQKTISEFTFETNQSFDYEIVTDDTHLLQAASGKYFREVLNVMDYRQFKDIMKDLKVEKMHELLRRHMQGMVFRDNEIKNFDFNKKIELEREKYRSLKRAVEDNFESIRKAQIDGRVKTLINSRDSAEKFLPALIKVYLENPDSSGLRNLQFLCEPYAREYAGARLDVSLIYQHFFSTTSENIREIKHRKGYISYDDQIKTIHRALDNRHFTEKLNAKYDAVFIDEFQDTDRLQYEIFSRVFEGKPVTYIGDPKQSIYGWRSADLDTYKAAKDAVGAGNIYTLGSNYRSTGRLLNALEKLMNPGGDYNMFMDENIRFESVRAGNDRMGDIMLNQEKVPALTIFEFDTDETNYKAVAQEVFLLLKNNYTINGKKVKPGNIGILVRENKQSEKIKKALSDFNIPSVQRDNSKVLGSGEASLVCWLISAALKPGRGEIFRVINSKWMGFNHETLLTVDEQIHIGFFLELRSVLQKEGVYNMISRFLDIYGVRQRCRDDVMGQRVLTNIGQIAEILHRLERRAKLKPEELIVWLQRQHNESSEEYEQRMESDEEAVQISTIHKAKGLQYKIVFAPALCIVPKRKLLNKNNVTFYKKEESYYFTFNYPALDQAEQQLHDLQKEQENKRLIYVALTRGVYKCYISYFNVKDKKNIESSFSEIYRRLDKTDPDIHYTDYTESNFTENTGKYEPDTENALKFQPRKPSLKSGELVTGRQIHSFSVLNSKHTAAPFTKEELADTYDRFIFQDLGRGASVGTALHSIFERLDFARPETWDQTLRTSAAYYPNLLKEEWMDHFRNLVQHTMNVTIDLNGEQFKLNRISSGQKLPELQFYFSMDKVNKQRINELLGDEADLGGEADIEGLMTGFVDLLFRHNDRYYILDWKSNHLGNSVSDYDRESLDTAMKGSNYNLQYIIYTLAVRRWLQRRIPDFRYEQHFGGVIYLFLRGLRQGSGTGIYTTLPDARLIENLDAAFTI